MIGLLTLFVLLLVFIATGMPVGFAIGSSAAIVLVFFVGVSPSQLVFSVIGEVDKWLWVSIPLFLVLGLLMDETGVIKRLVDLAQALIGHISGSLSHVVVLTHVMMAGMSGSIGADAAAVGTALIPSLKKDGYPAGFAAAIVGCGGIIGPMIPPSIPLIVMGVTGEISILRLWLGGAVPGLITGLALLIVGYIHAKGKGYSKSRPATWAQRGRTVVPALPALFVPVLIVAGIRLRFVTVIEGATVAITYVLIIAFLIYHWRNFKGFQGILVSSAKTTAQIMLMISMAGIFAFTLATLGGGHLVVNFLTSFTTNPTIFLVIVVVVFLFLGCFMESVALMLIFIPLLMPVIHALGIDPVHFGVVFTYVCLTGLLTPPVGGVMFMVNALAETDTAAYMKYGWPCVAALGIIGFLIAVVPQIVLFLPNLIMGQAIQ